MSCPRSGRKHDITEKQLPLKESKGDSRSSWVYRCIKQDCAVSWKTKIPRPRRKFRRFQRQRAWSSASKTSQLLAFVKCFFICFFFSFCKETSATILFSSVRSRMVQFLFRVQCENPAHIICVCLKLHEDLSGKEGILGKNTLKHNLVLHIAIITFFSNIKAGNIFFILDSFLQETSSGFLWLFRSYIEKHTCCQINDPHWLYMLNVIKNIHVYDYDYHKSPELILKYRFPTVLSQSTTI